jgi:hypothetical protein
LENNPAAIGYRISKKQTAMSQKLYLFGDSFGAYQKGWPQLVGVTNNYATRGSSEYRIYRNYSDVKPDGKSIFVHTHWSRIYLRADKSFVTRLLDTHKFSDMLISDLMSGKEGRLFEVCSEIWDERFFIDTYTLYMEKLLQTPDSLHVTFFEDIVHPQVVNLNAVWQSHSGPRETNHMTDAGNKVAAEMILERLNQ